MEKEGVVNVLKAAFWAPVPQATTGESCKGNSVPKGESGFHSSQCIIRICKIIMPSMVPYAHRVGDYRLECMPCYKEHICLISLFKDWEVLFSPMIWKVRLLYLSVRNNPAASE